jgi:hypothetical protein
VKDYVKVILSALITALITLTLTGAFNLPKERRKELIAVEKKAFSYTDKKIQDHEEKEMVRYKALKEDLTDMKGMLKFMYERELDKLK